MSQQRLFSLYRHDNNECLIADVPQSEIITRQASYHAHGGKSTLVVVPEGQEYPKPATVAAITTEGEPLEVQAVQGALPGMEEVAIAQSVAIEACEFILREGPKVGKNYSWSGVIKRVMNGKTPTADPVDENGKPIFDKNGRKKVGERTYLFNTVSEIVADAKQMIANREGIAIMKELSE